ncbi:MAG: bifunctional nuclease family protein [Ignavibacteria bacterium]|nr:bifunctional nuclease family protein [Ignavibacteria bacterium]
MDKIEVKAIGITQSPDSPNAYALILREKNGMRSLPIIIGPFEAQSIALVLEGLSTPRPLTHDLMRNLLEKLDAHIEEVYINDLRDGTFYARIIFDDPPIDIDARPSDAVALALRCQVPIFVNSEILDQAGINFTERHREYEERPETDIFGSQEEEEEEIDFTRKIEREKPKTKVERLQEELEKAIKEENYELAAKIRDELKKILKS